MKKIPSTILAVLALTTPAFAQGGYLGVSLQDADAPGALIYQVTTPSAAEIMGLQSGDRVLAVGDAVVRNSTELSQVIARHLPGEIISLAVVRGDSKMQIRGVLGRRPQQLQQLQPRMEWFQDAMPEFPPLNIELGGLQEEAIMTYPASTPEDEREDLIATARSRYGDDVVVKFEGNNTTVRIRSSFKSDGINSIEVPIDGLEGLLNDFEWVEEEASAAPILSVKDALQLGKPVILDFSAEWCKPCKMLSAQVFDNGKYSELTEQFTILKIDIDQWPSLAKQYGVSGIPDVRLLDSEGVERAKFVGFAGEQAVVEWLKQQSPMTTNSDELDTKAQIKAALRLELQKLKKELDVLREELREIPR